VCTSIKTLILALVLSISLPIVARQNNTRLLGWDLSYASVLKTNNVAQDAWLRKWLGQNYQSPVKKLIAEWKGEPIISSVLIEHPAFHAGEKFTMWFVRTSNSAYYWEFVEGKPRHYFKKSFDPKLYDNMLEEMVSWQQSKPLSPENTPRGGVPGYSGFLSTYKQGESRQMLLTLEDFFFSNKDNEEEVRYGRLSQAIEPIIKRGLN
jgi:hypothetical protein